MAYNSGNWENKEQRAEVARMHTEQMQEKYAQEIKAAIENTKIYNTDFKIKNIHYKSRNEDNGGGVGYSSCGESL